MTQLPKMIMSGRILAELIGAIPQLMFRLGVEALKKV